MTGAEAALAAAMVAEDWPFRLMNNSLKSMWPRIIPIGGMMMSFTIEVTIAPKAAPMITATARSRTLPFIMNALNSCNMFVSLFLSLLWHPACWAARYFCLAMILSLIFAYVAAGTIFLSASSFLAL